MKRSQLLHDCRYKIGKIEDLKALLCFGGRDNSKGGAIEEMPRPPDMTFQRLKELVAQNAPALYMHPRDSFMPCSVEWFMDNSELWLIENHEVWFHAFVRPNISNVQNASIVFLFRSQDSRYAKPPDPGLTHLVR